VEKAAEAEEAKHKIIVVDTATYVGKVSGVKLNGVPRRLAGIRLMFEELGPENYITTLTYKGTEACIFKK